MFSNFYSKLMFFIYFNFAVLAQTTGKIQISLKEVNKLGQNKIKIVFL